MNPVYVVGIIIGLGVPALLSMGIFATKADLERLRGDIASGYVLKQELDQRLSRLEQQMDRIIDMMEKR